MERRSFLQLSLGGLAVSALPALSRAGVSSRCVKLPRVSACSSVLRFLIRSSSGGDLAAMLAEQCSILVAENAMKWPLRAALAEGAVGDVEECCA
jgi:hypothetical protein